MSYRALCFLIVCASVSACSGIGSKAGPAEPVREAAPRTDGAREAQLEQRIARAELQLLEKETQLAEMQTRLDDARREVVRAMAKLQSLATRAEAASGIAEAEIALRALRNAENARGVPEVSELMQLSAAEFDKQNYGGALYLANQAKAAAAAARGQLASVATAELRPGEVPFALPLRLQTQARANVRQGPGGGFGIVFTLDPGAPLTGHSFVDRWVRVTDEAGRGGWIYQSLIGRRR